MIALKLQQLIGLLCACALICACVSRYTSRLNNTGNYVSIKDGRLGWSGIFINDAFGNIQKELGIKLDIHEQAFPTCGQYASQFVLNNRKVTLQWSASSVDATLDSIYVDLPIDEYALSPAAIAKQINNRLPRLEWATSGPDSAQLNYSNGDEILIKNGDDNFLLVSLESCLD